MFKWTDARPFWKQALSGVFMTPIAILVIIFTTVGVASAALLLYALWVEFTWSGLWTIVKVVAAVLMTLFVWGVGLEWTAEQNS